MADGATDANTVVARLIDAGSCSQLRTQTMPYGVADAMGHGDSPVILLADPASSYVCIGAHQDAARDIDLRACVQTNTPIIRRHTGGPALSWSTNDMLVHVVLPRAQPEAAYSAAGLFARFAEPVLRTWRSFGLATELGACGSIVLDRYRVAGVQVGLVGRAVVIGGGFAKDFDPDTIAQRASLPSDQMRERMRDRVREQLARANNQPVDRERLKQALLGHVGDVLGWRLEESGLRNDELAAIARRDSQMADSAHVYAGGHRLARAELRAVGGLSLVDIVHHGPAGQIRLRLLERAGVIEDIQFTGELTVLPTDGLERLAPRLVGLRRDAPDLGTRIQVEIALLGMELPGVTAADLAIALRPVVRPAGPDPLDLLFGNAANT